MRKARKFPPIFVSPREMREQIFDSFDFQTAQRGELRARHPFQIGERLRKFHYVSIGAALRMA